MHTGQVSPGGKSLKRTHDATCAPARFCIPGRAFDLPVEVDSDLWEGVREGISRICPGQVCLRTNGSEPFETDNRGFILDCSFGPTISDPTSLERAISDIPGVVEVGLFVGICDAVIVASNEGIEELIKSDGRI